MYHNGWKVRESEYTTGLAVDTCRYLQELQKRGAKAAALEVSSHALALQRMSGLPLHVAVVTNVTRDHIDFHGTEAAYLQAKLAILQLLVADGIAVLNADDHNFANFAARWEGRTISYGIHNANAALRAENIEADAAETRFELDYCGQRFPVSSRLIGRFQVYNILAAVSVAIAMGAQPAHAAAAIAGFSPVPGRMESYQLPNGAHALIDFAHNPDGLRNLLENCAALRSRRLLLVFGCGGDRDRGKRPIMGRIGADYADRCWITSDNPRTESPQQIFEDILAGIPDDSAHKVEVEPDRRKAIKLAYANSQPGDLIVIAGKGHEAYMIFGHTKHPYSDKEEVLDLR
ncbi:MAG: UDP-N-acetylmuramoyl-L-alanyl-D-glutamate--2,6-diaminopimelate ligase [Verrucomicrobia bacterium]|nr:UDP-N-acetylmuramoyl-L-alanyl-D-glutamate--2,6-diaminopimelate ligase [Verrucomicrobiota bacterium]